MNCYFVCIFCISFGCRIFENIHLECATPDQVIVNIHYIFTDFDLMYVLYLRTEKTNPKKNQTYETKKKIHMRITSYL